MLTREQILKVAPNIGRLDVPGLGGEVGIAEFTLAEADQISKGVGEELPPQVMVFIMGVCDADGKRLFTLKDAPKIKAMSQKIINPVVNAILTHNGMTIDDQEEAKNASGGTENAASASA